MPPVLPVLAALLLALGCVRSPSGAAPAWTRAEYFDPAMLHPDPAVGRARQEGYAAALSAMGEPSFIELARRPGRSFRFLWLRHWHGAVSVRVSQVGDLAVADLRVLRRPPSEGGGGGLAASRRVVIDAAGWEALLDRVQAAGFWTAPTQDPHDQPGPEGSRWVFEGIDDGRLQVVDRFSPDDPALVGLGLYMVALAGLDVPHREVY